MTRLLIVLASPSIGDAAWSTRAAHVLAARLTADEENPQIVVRDLSAEPPPHLGDLMAQALQRTPDERTAEQAATLTLGEAYAADLAEADLIIIATPALYFGPPSQLKAWIDHILAPTTLWTGPGRPVRRYPGKRVIVVETRVPLSGVESGDTRELLAPYLRAALGRLSLSNIEFVMIDCLGQDPEVALKAFDDSLRDIGRRFP